MGGKKFFFFKKMNRTDASRVQELVQSLPVWKIDASVSGKVIRAMLVEFGVVEAKTVVEAEELRKMLLQKIQTLRCPICLVNHQEGDYITRLPCGHGFHHKCAHEAAQFSFEQEKLEANNSWPRPRCPICRCEIAARSSRKRRRDCDAAPIVQS